MIKRMLQDTISRALATFPAVVVTGARQTGKTTLLRMGWEKTHRYLSMDNPDVRSRAIADPAGFLNSNRPPVIIDEIQYAPDLLSYIKTRIDEDRKPGQWLLTGSQTFPLMQGISESLAGRVAVLRLLPFSFAEAEGEGQQPKTIDQQITYLFAGQHSEGRCEVDLGDWLLRGAYPEPRTNRKVDRDLWCGSYIQTYLERDVRHVLSIGDLNTFERFLRLVAARTGQILNLSDLARDTGISPPTAKRWLSVLESSGLLFLLPPYFNNFGKRLIKSPKLYFLDTALAAYLTGLHAAGPLLSGPMIGPLFETSVVSAWVKAFYHRGEMPSLYYWRSRSGLEVDLLVERNNRLYPMEIKSTSTVTANHATQLNRWRKAAGEMSNSGLIVGAVDEASSVSPGIRAVPWFWL